jgi:WD40 repeat protein
VHPSQLASEDHHDTALARILHREGLLPLETIQTVLADVRARRQVASDVTLAGTLLARGSVSGDQLDRAHALLAAESGVQAASQGTVVTGGALGAYQVVREIARGGMGVVYEARHTETGAAYALKTILVETGGIDPEEIERFRREGEAMARLQHPNVARVYAADFSGRTPYLVQDMLTGGTLEDHGLNRELEAAEVQALTLGLAEGLAHSHAAGILHRDLKPENVLFSADGVPKLVDFGLAFKVGANSQRLTATGALMGTPAYMAPEQALGLKDFDGRVDVYGLGGILYFLLCGHAPFAGGLYRILEQVVNSPPERPSKRREGVSRSLEAICLKALAKEPEERFASMEDFAVALRGVDGARPGQGAAKLGLAAAFVLAAGLGLAAYAGTRGGEAPSPSVAMAESPRATEAPEGSPTSAPTVTPSPTPASRPLALTTVRSWEPGAGALGGEGRGVARVGSQVVTLERPTTVARERSGHEHYHERLGVVRIWDFESGGELRRLDFGASDVFGMAASPDRSQVAFVTAKRVFVYDTANWSRRHDLERPQADDRASRAPALEFSPSGKRLALTHGARGEVLVWDLPGGELQVFSVEKASRLAFRGETQLLLGRLNPPRLALFDLERGEIVQERVLGKRVQAAPKALLVSPDGSRAYVGCWGRTLRVWDLEGWKELRSLELTGSGTQLRFGPAGEALWVFAFQGPILRVSLSSFEVERVAKAWGRRVTSGEVLEGGETLVVGTDQRLRRLSLEGAHLWKTRRDAGPVRAIAPGDPQLGVLIADGNGLWRLRGLEEAPIAAIRRFSAGSLEFLSLVPGKARQVWLGWGTTTRLWSFEALPFATLGELKRAEITSLAGDPSGRRALATLEDVKEKTYQLVQLQVVEGQTISVSAVAGRAWRPPARRKRPPTVLVTADGWGVSGDSGGVLETWDLNRRGLLGRSARGKAGIVSLASYRRVIYAGTSTGEVRRRALRANFEEAPLAGQRGPILALSVLPGRRLASASEDGTLRFYDLDTGRVLHEIDYSERADAPQHLALTPQGELLVCTLRGWVYRYALK